MVEVYISYPCFYMTSLCLHGNKSAVHVAHHVSNAIHCREFHLYRTFLIVKNLHFVRLVEIIVDGVLIVTIFCRKRFVARQILSNAFYKPFYLLVVLVLPRMGVPPMVLKVLLNLSHLLLGCCLSIFLHTGV